MRTSFHHQPEAQHPKSSAIHKLPADYPIYWMESGLHWLAMSISAFDPKRTQRLCATLVLRGVSVAGR